MVPLFMDVSRSALVDCISNKTRTPGSIRESDPKLLECEKLALRILRCQSPFEPNDHVASLAVLHECHERIGVDDEDKRAGEVYRIINSFLIISDN